MVRKQLYLTQEQDTKVKRLARRGGKTEAEVIREALDAYDEHAEPVVTALRERGLLADPPQPHLTRARAQEVYNEYRAWALTQPALGLLDAVLAEREESR
jgi:hypothetical protein